MNTTKNAKEKKLCAICELEGKCVGFSIYCCKSCSVFYRRSYRLRNVLKCKREGNCNLRHEMRNGCRGCRLQACRKLGLRMVGKNLIVQNNGYPEDDIDEDEPSIFGTQKEGVPDEPHATKTKAQPNNQTPAVSSQQQAAVNFAPKVDEMFPELRRIVEAFVNFENNQRVISSIQQGKQIQAYESIYINKCQQFTMESATLRLFQQMIEQLLGDCNLKETEIKSVFEHCPLQLATAHKAELTYRVFPTSSDPSVSYYIGFHVNINKLEHFLNNSEDFERLKKIAWPLIHKRWIAAERCRQLKPLPIEWCAFVGFLIFEEVSRLNIKNEAITQRQNALYAEYFQYLLSIYRDPRIVAGRIIKIISFTHEIGLVREEHSQMYSIADVFLPSYQLTSWVNKPEPATSLNMDE